MVTQASAGCVKAIRMGILGKVSPSWAPSSMGKCTILFGAAE